MAERSLASALEREHHEIDGEIEAFIAGLDEGRLNPEPLTEALTALRRHIYLEEAILFPPIRDGGLVMPIFVMVREHGELWRAMEALSELLEAGADAALLQRTCRALLAQLDQHNQKEEPVIYPHADTGLPDQVSAELARFMATGRMPDGWVCEQARTGA